MKKEEKNKKNYYFVPPEFQKEYEKAMKKEEHDKAMKEYEEYNEEFKKKSEKFRETVRKIREEGPLGDKRQVEKIENEEIKERMKRDKITKIERVLKQFTKQNYPSQEKIVKKINKIGDNLEIIYKDKKDGRFYKDKLSIQELLSMDFEQETK